MSGKLRWAWKMSGSGLKKKRANGRSANLWAISLCLMSYSCVSRCTRYYLYATHTSTGQRLEKKVRARVRQRGQREGLLEGAGPRGGDRQDGGKGSRRRNLRSCPSPKLGTCIIFWVFFKIESTFFYLKNLFPVILLHQSYLKSLPPAKLSW